MGGASGAARGEQAWGKGREGRKGPGAPPTLGWGETRRWGDGSGGGVLQCVRAAALRARRGELEAAEAVVGVAGCPSAPFKGVRGGGGRARRWRLGERRGAP